jgi:hypothetical protein
MPSSPILSVETVDWTYEDVAEELEHLAMIEDLEPPSGPSLSDLPSLLFDDDLLRFADELATVAELEAR